MVDGWLQAASSQQQTGRIVLPVSWNIDETFSVEKNPRKNPRSEVGSIQTH
jgi:hypothetical protein